MAKGRPFYNVLGKLAEVSIELKGEPCRLYFYRGNWYVAAKLGETVNVKVTNNTIYRIEVLLPEDYSDLGKRGQILYDRKGYDFSHAVTVDSYRTDPGDSSLICIAIYKDSSDGDGKFDRDSYLPAEILEIRCNALEWLKYKKIVV